MKYVIKCFIILGMIGVALLPLLVNKNVVDSGWNLAATMWTCFLLGFIYNHINKEIDKVYKVYKDSKLKEDETD